MFFKCLSKPLSLQDERCPKKTRFETRLIVVVLAALLVLSVFNTYLIFVGTQSSMSTNAVNLRLCVVSRWKQLQVEEHVNRICG